VFLGPEHFHAFLQDGLPEGRRGEKYDEICSLGLWQMLIAFFEQSMELHIVFHTESPAQLEEIPESSMTWPSHRIHKGSYGIYRHKSGIEYKVKILWSL